MKTATSLPTGAGPQYAAAYAAHYTTRDLPDALRLYGDIIPAHPNTPEDGYSRSQSFNIAKSVAPNQELLDTQTELSLAHLGHDTPPDLEPLPVTPHPSGPPSQRKATRSTGEAVR